MARPSKAWPVALALACALAAGSARAGPSGREPAPLRDGESAAGSPGFVAFPRGDVFQSFLADPKAEGTFVSYLGTQADPPTFGSEIGSMGIGDRLGLFRINAPTAGDGIQASLAANVYSQFRLGVRPMELVNTDFQLGLPVTFRRGRFSSRLRLYHQSSHLGDGALLEGVRRLDPTYLAAEWMISGRAGPLRAYGGGEYQMSGLRLDQDTRVGHIGMELRQSGGLGPGGALARAHLVAGVDVKSLQALSWTTQWSARVGVEVGRATLEPDRSRIWSLLAEYYEGPIPFGQFDRERVSWFGLGVHLAP